MTIQPGSNIYQDPPVGVSNGLPHTTYRLPDRAPLRMDYPTLPIGFQTGHPLEGPGNQELVCKTCDAGPT